MLRFILLTTILFSFNSYADEVDGLPELATESEKRKLQNKRSKVLTPSVAKRVRLLFFDEPISDHHPNHFHLIRALIQEDLHQAKDMYRGGELGR